MNHRILAAVIAAASLVSASAFADSRYDNNVPDLQVVQSQLTRAEVRSELARAYASGELYQTETGLKLVTAVQAETAAPAISLTRADVRAQLNGRNLFDQDNRS